MNTSELHFLKVHILIFQLLTPRQTLSIPHLTFYAFYLHPLPTRSSLPRHVYSSYFLCFILIIVLNPHPPTTYSPSTYPRLMLLQLRYFYTCPPLSPPPNKKNPLLPAYTSNIYTIYTHHPFKPIFTPKNKIIYFLYFTFINTPPSPPLPPFQFQSQLLNYSFHTFY